MCRLIWHSLRRLLWYLSGNSVTVFAMVQHQKPLLMVALVVHIDSFNHPRFHFVHSKPLSEMPDFVILYNFIYQLNLHKTIIRFTCRRTLFFLVFENVKVLTIIAKIRCRFFKKIIIFLRLYPAKDFLTSGAETNSRVEITCCARIICLVHTIFFKEEIKSFKLLLVSIRFKYIIPQSINVSS